MAGELTVPPFQRNRRNTRTYDAQSDNLQTEVLPALLQAQMPAGAIVPSFAEVEPANGAWKLLNGQELPKADFPRLYALIGGRFGETADNFTLPDLRGRSIIGVGGTPALGLFDVAGQSEVELTEAQMPRHSHSVTDPGHTHGLTLDPHTHDFTAGTPHSHTSANVGPVSAAAGTDHPIPVAGSTSAETVSGTIGPTTITGSAATAQTGISLGQAGAGDPVNILPPVIGVHWLIRT